MNDYMSVFVDRLPSKRQETYKTRVHTRARVLTLSKRRHNNYNCMIHFYLFINSTRVLPNTKIERPNRQWLWFRTFIKDVTKMYNTSHSKRERRRILNTSCWWPSILVKENPTLFISILFLFLNILVLETYSKKIFEMSSYLNVLVDEQIEYWINRIKTRLLIS